ncbi:MAG: tRNA pseudouridine(55) synthase TruB [Chloroflexota bacterium]
MGDAPAGVLVVDKPLGLTSHDVVQRVRRATGIRRVGHAGTLDPLATGVLVVCVGWATRLIEYLVDSRKTYETTVRLGRTTTTYDAEGEIVAERPAAVTPDQLHAALIPFRGPIRQKAPAYSAIKKDGQPLYKAARRGEAVEAPVRQVTIDTLELLDFRPPDVDLRVVCSAGTYPVPWPMIWARRWAVAGM